MAAAKPVKFRARIQKFKDDSGWHYLSLPQTVFRALGGKLRVRLLCVVNATEEFPAALMSAGKEANACVFLSKQRLKDAGLREGQLADVVIRLDKSKYGMPLPEELKEVFKQDTEALRRFDLLKPGKQRNIIYTVISTKNESSRVDRAFMILDNLKRLPEDDMSEFYSIFRVPKKGETPRPEAVNARAMDDELMSRFLPITALEASSRARDDARPARSARKSRSKEQ